MLRRNCFFIIILTLLILFFLFLNYYYDKCKINTLENLYSAKQKNVENISCLIDGKKFLQCLRKGNEIYFPFYKFIKKQFDVDGKLNEGLFKNKRIIFIFKM